MRYVIAAGGVALVLGCYLAVRRLRYQDITLSEQRAKLADLQKGEVFRYRWTDPGERYAPVNRKPQSVTESEWIRRHGRKAS